MPIPAQNLTLTLRRPLRRKLRMRWFFDVSKVKESSFFKSDLTDPSSDFWCASFGKNQFKPLQISFFSRFYIKIVFWVRWFKVYSHEWDWREKTVLSHTNQPLITSFYIQKLPIFAELAMSQRLSAIFCATGVWGDKPIGRVRVKDVKQFLLVQHFKLFNPSELHFWFVFNIFSFFVPFPALNWLKFWSVND